MNSRRSNGRQLTSWKTSQHSTSLRRLGITLEAAPQPGANYVRTVRTVVNGASDLLVEVVGEEGRHARCATGVASLPRGMAVEIDMVVEVRD